MKNFTELEIKEIIFKKIGISIDEEVTFLFETEQISTYKIGGQKLLRLSTNAISEVNKLERLNKVAKTPKLHSTGQFELESEIYHYAIVDFIAGEELWSEVSNLNTEQQSQLGQSIADFLTDLHQIKGKTYDIGHYIPTIPQFTGAWKEGHLEYISYLEKNVPVAKYTIESQAVIQKAFDYLKENINALDFDNGAVLLHNDFHPKNMIIDDGELVGVIDWECSQFGEADFELSNLFQWCFYPPTAEKYDITALVKSVFINYPEISKIKQVATRLTIYQIEEELNQLIWGGNETERTLRINFWLGGAIDHLI